jgi:hypothetical protein
MARLLNLIFDNSLIFWGIFLILLAPTAALSITRTSLPRRWHRLIMLILLLPPFMTVVYGSWGQSFNPTPSGAYGPGSQSFMGGGVSYGGRGEVFIALAAISVFILLSFARRFFIIPSYVFYAFTALGIGRLTFLGFLFTLGVVSLAASALVSIGILTERKKGKAA